MSRLHPWTTVIAALVVLVFLSAMPAPKGCGCDKRKQRLQKLGGSVFGA